MTTSLENTISLIRRELTDRLSPNWRSFRIDGGQVPPNTVLLFYIFPDPTNPPNLAELNPQIQRQLQMSGYVMVSWRSRNFRNYRVSNDTNLIETENRLLSTLILNMRDTLSPFFNFEVETFVDDNGETIEIERV